MKPWQLASLVAMPPCRATKAGGVVVGRAMVRVRVRMERMDASLRDTMVMVVSKIEPRESRFVKFGESGKGFLR